MKKILLLIAVFSLLLIPSNVFAETTVTGLKEAVEEEIQLFGSAEGYEEGVQQLKDIDLSGYSENDDKVNVYLFRGSTCSHCFNAVLYFASIAGESGKYFNLKSYEVWNNTENSELMEKVGAKLNDEVSGVPYIVVGDKSWSGFADSYGEEILSKIKSEYEKPADERTDIVKDIVSGTTSDSSSNDVIALLIILLVTGAIVAGIVVTRKKAS